MTEKPLQLWSDNEAEIDLLRFGYLADTIARVVSTPELLPVTVGVFGDWGGGKSTLVRLARQRLDGKSGVLTLSFNGWFCEGYDDAKSALMGTILDSIEDALQGTAKWTDALRDRVRRMAQRVDWLQALGMIMRYGGPIALTGDPRAGIVGRPSRVWRWHHMTRGGRSGLRAPLVRVHPRQCGACALLASATTYADHHHLFPLRPSVFRFPVRLLLGGRINHALGRYACFALGQRFCENWPACCCCRGQDLPAP